MCWLRYRLPLTMLVVANLSGIVVLGGELGTPPIRLCIAVGVNLLMLATGIAFGYDVFEDMPRFSDKISWCPLLIRLLNLLAWW